jgi:hypothetical protein
MPTTRAYYPPIREKNDCARNSIYLMRRPMDPSAFSYGMSRYWMTACCCEHDGWSSGMSATCAQPDRIYRNMVTMCPLPDKMN